MWGRERALCNAIIYWELRFGKHLKCLTIAPGILAFGLKELTVNLCAYALTVGQDEVARKVEAEV